MLQVEPVSDKGCEDDIWFTRSAMAGENVPLRADRWFQSPPLQRMTLPLVKLNVTVLLMAISDATYGNGLRSGRI